MSANAKSAVSVTRNGDKLAYVKVEMRARSRKPWGWSLYRDGSNVAIEQSEVLFGCAEDAWKAGQQALSQCLPARCAA